MLDDGLLRDVPILNTVVGLGKCIRNVSDVLFAKKLMAFLYGLKDSNKQQREDAIAKWESDAKKPDSVHLSSSKTKIFVRSFGGLSNVGLIRKKIV